MKSRRSEDEVRIWRRPQRGERYVWGGDVAEGLEHGDYSVIEILSLDHGDQVAEYQGKREGMELGELAYLMGQWYNWAYGAFENNADQTPNNKLLELKYPKLHFQQDHSKGYPVDTDKAGWNTNLHTRYRMVRQARSLLRDGSIVIRSQHLLDEMEIFARNSRGKYAALPGGHDDLVMAFLIATQMYYLVVQLEEYDSHGIAPMVKGQEVKPGQGDTNILMEDEDPRTREERLGEAAVQRIETQAQEEVMAMEMLI